MLQDDGSTFHLGTKKGDLFPRIITVGCPQRAELVAQHLDSGVRVTKVMSGRSMLTISGRFRGVGVSIIAIGMGAPMMDFMLREATMCVDGPLAVIRLGTCGIVNKHIAPGTIMTAGKGCCYIFTNYARFNGCRNMPSLGTESPPYLITDPIQPDEDLQLELVQQLKLHGCEIFDGLNASCETFYSCQGRDDPGFEDKNEELFTEVVKYGIDSLEMEAHQLFHLAAQKRQTCRVAACAVGMWNRSNSGMPKVSEAKLQEVTNSTARACLEAVIAVKM